MAGLCRIALAPVVAFAAEGQEFSDPNPGPETDSRTLDYYESILTKHPDMAEARFGAGWAAHKADDYNRALSEFESALATRNPDLRSKTYFNLGNTLNAQGRLDESLQAYRRALETNPRDFDAKYNYELTRRMITQSQNRQTQPSPGGNSEEKPESEEKDQRAPQQESQQNQPRDRAQQDTRKEEAGKDDRASPQQTEHRKTERKPDAESILNALKADEKNLMKRQLGHANSKKLEKDW